MTPTNDRKSGELYTAFLVIVVVITAGILLTAGLSRLVGRLGPQTGDIIAFPAARVPSVSTASFAASSCHRPGRHVVHPRRANYAEVRREPGGGIYAVRA